MSMVSLVIAICISFSKRAGIPQDFPAKGLASTVGLHSQRVPVFSAASFLPEKRHIR